MQIALGLAILILLGAVAGTVFVMRNEDAKYGESAKRNTFNLTAIYTAAFILIAAGTIWFIVSAG